MALINVRVEKITDEAIGIRSFVLRKIGLLKLPPYTPGSHIDVHCGDGIIRQYSLCGDPNDRRRLMIAVKQNEPSRGGSDLMHLAVKTGDRLEIGSPRNNFPLDQSAEHVILLAGGIGITPIIAMADHLHGLGKPFALHYFSRGPEYTAFQARLQQGAYADSVTFHHGLDSAATQATLRNILIAPLEPVGTTSGTASYGPVYLCGPGPFMDAAEAIALENRAADAVKLERFSANPALADTPTHAFEVELARSGTKLQVGANETILDVLEAHNIEAAFSCEQGVCGTCVTAIIAGEAEHRDSFLSDKQKASNTRICLCVSRAKGDKLVLDL